MKHTYEKYSVAEASTRLVLASEWRDLRSKSIRWLELFSGDGWAWTKRLAALKKAARGVLSAKYAAERESNVPGPYTGRLYRPRPLKKYI